MKIMNKVLCGIGLLLCGNGIVAERLIDVQARNLKEQVQQLDDKDFKGLSTVVQEVGQARAKWYQKRSVQLVVGFLLFSLYGQYMKNEIKKVSSQGYAAGRSDSKKI